MHLTNVPGYHFDNLNIIPAQVPADKVLEELLQQGPPADFSYSSRHAQL